MPTLTLTEPQRQIMRRFNELLAKSNVACSRHMADLLDRRKGAAFRAAMYRLDHYRKFAAEQGVTL